MIKVPSYIETLKPYKSGNKLDKKLSQEEFKKLINLASNENPLGPSPLAVEAIQNHQMNLNKYPDPSAPDLVEALAKDTNRKPEEIVTGHGSDSLIQYIFNAFAEKGDEILTADATFIGTYVNANKFGLTTKKLPLTSDYRFDLPNIAKAISDKTKIIYLANPNNPTGTMFTKKEFDDFIKLVPNNILIVLDEAYWIYAEQNEEYPNGLSYDLPNIIVLRTMSKSYGLAGLRIGYAIAREELINYIYRVKLPFEPHSLAQIAAIAALNDKEYLSDTLETNLQSILTLCDGIDKLNIERTVPAANFTMMIFENEAKAKSIVDGFLDNGIITRHLPMFGLPNAVRISTGTVPETEKAMSILKKIY
ncbi:histidinol-phosphate transaminase [Candidatus Kapabacteria bacterium]|nr:histidinol-phosphate transaminase [Candidatus Kapabacteria bacterium]